MKTNKVKEGEKLKLLVKLYLLLVDFHAYVKKDWENNFDREMSAYRDVYTRLFAQISDGQIQKSAFEDFGSLTLFYARGGLEYASFYPKHRDLCDLMDDFGYYEQFIPKATHPRRVPSNPLRREFSLWWNNLLDTLKIKL